MELSVFTSCLKPTRRCMYVLILMATLGILVVQNPVRQLMLQNTTQLRPPAVYYIRSAEFIINAAVKLQNASTISPVRSSHPPLAVPTTVANRRTTTTTIITTTTTTTTTKTPTATTKASSSRTPKPVKPKKKPCMPNVFPKVDSKKFHPNVTVVTAYFNIGKFQKGSSSLHFDTKLYMKWSKVYEYLTGPVVFYTDCNVTAALFRKMRRNVTSLTKIIEISRNDLWSFKYLDKIRKVYSNPHYPKHHPNTVVPEYPCIQHSKYALVEEAMKRNYFNTTFFAWIDLGYFRGIVGKKNKFVIVPPNNFDASRVAMTFVSNADMTASVDSIFKGNRLWLGGGMFFGSIRTLPMFIADYRKAVERYLNMSLSNTDQQVIYAMNTVVEKRVLRARVHIQIYAQDVEGVCWFYLGYFCYRELV